MELLEREIEERLRKRVFELHGRCLKFNCLSAAGVPDRIVLLPGGRVYFVELKRPKGGVKSSLQKYWDRELDRLQIQHYTVWTMDECESLIRYFEVIQNAVQAVSFSDGRD